MAYQRQKFFLLLRRMYNKRYIEPHSFHISRLSVKSDLNTFSFVTQSVYAIGDEKVDLVLYYYMANENKSWYIAQEQNSLEWFLPRKRIDSHDCVKYLNQLCTAWHRSLFFLNLLYEKVFNFVHQQNPLDPSSWEILFLVASLDSWLYIYTIFNVS